VLATLITLKKSHKEEEEEEEEAIFSSEPSPHQGIYWEAKTNSEEKKSGAELAKTRHTYNFSKNSGVWLSYYKLENNSESLGRKKMGFKTVELYSLRIIKVLEISNNLPCVIEEEMKAQNG
jgi:hypothetical protein